MFKTAITAGVKVSEFWDMSVAEIMAVVDGYNRRVTADLKNRAYMDYNLAYMIGSTFCGKMPDLYTIYSGLFAEEAQAAALAKFKAQMFEYMDYNNRKRGGDN